MTKLQKLSLIIGVAIGVVAIIEKISSFKIWSKFLLPFIKWWPSGYIILSLLLMVVLILQSAKIRAWYYLNKYGDKSKINNLYFFQDSNKVYLATKDKYLRWIKNPETLRELGYDFPDVLIGHRSWFRDYKTGTAISIYFWK